MPEPNAGWTEGNKLFNHASSLSLSRWAQRSPRRLLSEVTRHSLYVPQHSIPCPQYSSSPPGLCCREHEACFRKRWYPRTATRVEEDVGSVSVCLQVCWDLALVLKALIKLSFKPMEQTQLKWLSLKMAQMLALTSVEPLSDLKALLVEMDFLPKSLLLAWESLCGNDWAACLPPWWSAEISMARNTMPR